MHQPSNLTRSAVALAAVSAIVCASGAPAGAAVSEWPPPVLSRARVSQPITTYPTPHVEGEPWKLRGLGADERSFEACLAYHDAGMWPAAGLCFERFWETYPASPLAYEALNLAAKHYEKARHLAPAIKLREVLAADYFATDGGLESVLVLPGLYGELGLASVYPSAPEWLGSELGVRFLDVPEARMRGGRHALEVVPVEPVR